MDVLDPLIYKGVPLDARPTLDGLATCGWNVAHGDTATPVATLSASALEHNAAEMARYCAERGIDLAPHAKTTLAAGLIDLQTRHGAWALTAALPRQAALLWQQGVNRVLLANEVTDPAALRILLEQRDAAGGRDLLVYADSLRGVELLERGARDATRPLDVLVEVGYPGGRTGCRTVVAALEVASAIAAAGSLRLAGVSGYEGTIAPHRSAAGDAAVDAFLETMRMVAVRLVNGGLVDPAEAVVTAGGSIFFDRVAAVLRPWCGEQGARLVLRSGCYLIHDHGIYATGTPAANEVPDAPHFTAALSVWARVVSRPENGLALLDAGRRDVSFDSGLPIPLERWRDGATIELGSAAISTLSDQHAFLSWSGELDVIEGDIVRLGISHPCTTLDRWRLLFVLDDDHEVVGGVTTVF
ncbi:MAG TPA: alanine racemase [Jatrophihabitans sp.]|jgi:D-serine deaminase-like pyridoxal phosphate-dependent protein|nr:alanine racemase [Jatrophihabitans sp.]